MRKTGNGKVKSDLTFTANEIKIAIDKCERMRRITGNIKINGNCFQVTPVYGWTVVKYTSADGGRANKDHQFGLRDGFITDPYSFRHILSNGPGNHDAICMTRTGNKFDPVPSHVKIHVSCCIQLHLSRIIATRRDLP